MKYEKPAFTIFSGNNARGRSGMALCKVTYTSKDR